MKFKGLIEHYSFVKLSKEERDLFLIDNKIFVKSKDPLFYEFDSDELYHHYSHEVSKIFANNLKTFKGEFTLNPILLEEIKKLVFEQCKKKFESLLTREEVFREQFYAYPVEKIEEIKISTRTSNGQKLSSKLYFNLSKLDFKDFQSHLGTIENFIKYDHKYIYDYLTGLDNESTYFYLNYHPYILNNLYFSILEEVEEFNSLSSGKKGSIPKRIALMYELGILNSEIFKNLSNPKKVKVVSYILGYELIGDRKTSLRKNITSLNPKSIMNPDGMASIHLHYILKEALDS